MSSGGRRALAALATGLASASLLLTVLAHYAMAVDSAGFADRAVAVVRARPVQSLIVGSVSGRLEAALGGSLGGVQPVVKPAVRDALFNGQVTAEVRAAAASLQSQLLSGHAGSLVLTLPGIGPAMASSIQARSPELAAEVQRLGSLTIVDVRIPPSAAQAVNDVAYLGRDATLLIILTLALAVLALLLAPVRRRTLIGLGIGACLSGLLAAGLYVGGRQLVLQQFSSPAGRSAGGAVWNVYLGGLEPVGYVLAGIGAAVAALAALSGAGRSSRADSHGLSSV